MVESQLQLGHTVSSAFIDVGTQFLCSLLSPPVISGFFFYKASTHSSWKPPQHLGLPQGVQEFSSGKTDIEMGRDLQADVTVTGGCEHLEFRGEVWLEIDLTVGP